MYKQSLGIAWSVNICCWPLRRSRKHDDPELFPVQHLQGKEEKKLYILWEERTSRRVTKKRFQDNHRHWWLKIHKNTEWEMKIQNIHRWTDSWDLPKKKKSTTTIPQYPSTTYVYPERTLESLLPPLIHSPPPSPSSQPPSSSPTLFFFAQFRT